MSIPVTCPVCGKSLKAPDGTAGKTAKCPRCSELLRVPDDSLTEFPSPAPVDKPPASRFQLPSRKQDQELLPPETLQQQPLEVRVKHELAVPGPVTPATVGAQCPFCAEPIQAAAKKCKHCGEFLDPALRAAMEASRRREGPAQAPVTVNNVTNVAVPEKKGEIGCVTALVIIILLFFFLPMCAALLG